MVRLNRNTTNPNKYQAQKIRKKNPAIVLVEGVEHPMLYGPIVLRIYVSNRLDPEDGDVICF